MPTPFQSQPPPGTTVAPLADAVRRIEAAESLDAAADVLDRVADVVLVSRRVGSVLRGEPIGHAAHPLLTDFPLGAWTCTSLLDLFGGRRSRPAATGLLSFGVAAAVPTVAAGLAELRAATGQARRVSVVHAAVNGTALTLYSASLVARLRGRHGTAVALGVVGGVAATLGGWFGGHLSLAMKVGTADEGLFRNGGADGAVAPAR
jgi:uncharacterized membrane protein